MDNIWNLLKGLVGLPEIPSPRKDLLDALLQSMLSPQPADLVAQSYFDKLGLFAFIAAMLLVIQFAVSSVQGIMGGSLGQRMRDWVYTALFLFVLVPVIPAMLVATQVFFNLLGKQVFLLMLGTDNAQNGVAALSGLTGNPAIDLILSFCQIGFLLVLMVELKLVVIAMYASVIALIVGVALKFLGTFGDMIFRLGIYVTIFGVAGNAIVLVIMGIIVGFGKIASRGDTLSMGLINTGAIFVSLIGLHLVLKQIGGQLKAAASGIGRGLGNVKNRIRNNDSTYESDGDDRQIDESAKTHRRHAKHSTSDQQSTRGTDTSTDTQGGNRSPITDYPTNERRHSSILARSRSKPSSEGDTSTPWGASQSEQTEHSGRSDSSSTRREEPGSNSSVSQNGTRPRSTESSDSSAKQEPSTSGTRGSSDSSSTRREEPTDPQDPASQSSTRRVPAGTTKSSDDTGRSA